MYYFCKSWLCFYYSAIFFLRFYLGLALSLRTGGPQARAAEAFAYIQEAIELLLAKQTNLALAPETG